MKACVEDYPIYQFAIVCLTPKNTLDTSLLDVSGIDETSMPSIALTAGNWKLETARDVLEDASTYDDGLVVKMTPVTKTLARVTCGLAMDEDGKTDARLCVTVRLNRCLLSAGRVLEAVSNIVKAGAYVCSNGFIVLS